MYVYIYIYIYIYMSCPPGPPASRTGRTHTVIVSFWRDLDLKGVSATKLLYMYEHLSLSLYIYI